MPNADRLARAGEKLLSESQPDEAARAFRDALMEDKDHAPARLGLARLAVGLQLPAPAAQLLDGLLQREPKNAEALVLRGLVEEGRGDLDAALALYRRAAAASPAAPFTRYQLGRALCVAGQHPEAVAELQEAARLDPRATVVPYALGAAFLQSGKLGEAIGAFTRVLELDPRFPDGYLTLADVLCVARREDMAAKVLEQGRALLPENGALCDLLAAVRLKQGDPKGAVEALHARTAVEPSEDAFFNLATTAISAGDVPAAAAAIDRLLKDFPKSWRGHHLRSMLFDAADRVDQAIAELREAHALAPKEWRPLNDLGSLLNARKSPEAVATLEQAAALAPDEAAPLYNLGLAYWTAGRAADARKAIERLLGRISAAHPVAPKARELLEAMKKAH